jgi:hypothetical protein
MTNDSVKIEIKKPGAFRGATLEDAALRHADLRGADLRGANLQRADLSYAQLEGALLRGANVAGTNLSGASLSSADTAALRYDENTLWPDGFDPAVRCPARSPETEQAKEAGCDFTRKVVAAYFAADGRLLQIPVRSDAKKLVISRRLVRSFSLGRRYTEKEVSNILSAFHADFATLRRMLVDYRFLARANSIYWRIWVESPEAEGAWQA